MLPQRIHKTLHVRNISLIGLHGVSFEKAFYVKEQSVTSSSSLAPPGSFQLNRKYDDKQKVSWEQKWVQLEMFLVFLLPDPDG